MYQTKVTAHGRFVYYNSVLVAFIGSDIFSRKDKHYG